MKKTLRMIAITLCLVMGLTCMPSGNMTQEVSASYYYLNTTYKHVTAGSSFVLKVNGTTKTVKWSTSNAKIATVKKGKVTTKIPGDCYIYAKVGSQKLSCRVSVSVNTNKALKNMSYTYETVSRGIIMTAKNNNAYPVRYNASLILLDNGGAMLDTVSGDYAYIPAKSTAKIFYRTGTKTFNSYKLSPTISDYTFVSARNKLVISSNVGADGKIIAEVKNTSKKEIRSVNLVVIYYDEAGTPVDCEDGYFTSSSTMDGGSTQYAEFSSCKDASYSAVTFSSYKIFINSAVYSD